MSGIVSRLFMCIGLIIGCVVLWILIFAPLESSINDEQALLAAGVVTILVFSTAWVLIWVQTVKWTGWRIAATGAVAFGCLVVSLLIGVLALGLLPGYSNDEMAIVLATMTWPAPWLIGTAIAWRESPRERGRRLSRMGVGAVACPKCGYNLTGLREAKCPECGSSFTIDQIVAHAIEQARPAEV